VVDPFPLFNRTLIDVGEALDRGIKRLHYSGGEIHRSTLSPIEGRVSFEPIQWIKVSIIDPINLTINISFTVDNTGEPTQRVHTAHH
jgi:hypothetical protein